MDIIVVKVLSGILFFVVALSFGWLPFCLYRRLYSSRQDEFRGNTSATGTESRKDIVMHSLHSLASGVLIATCLLHLLPESLEAVGKGLESGGMKHNGQNTLANIFHANNASSAGEEYIEKVDKNDARDTDFYPVAECLLAIGFMFVYMFDSLMKAAKSKSNVKYKFSRLANDDCDSTGSSSETELEEEIDHNFSKLEETKELMQRSLKTPSHASNLSQSSDKHGFCPCCKEGRLCFRELQIRASIKSVENTTNQGSMPNTTNGHPDVQSAALVMALCVHGFFDGVLLGLQTSDAVILSLLFALSLHKSFVSLSLSLTLAKNYTESNSADDNTTLRSKSRYFLYILSFALVAPLGLATSATFVHARMWMSLSEDSNEDSLLPGCLQAFAVGTFLYVTFTETTKRHGKTATVWTEIRGHVSLLAGFSLMAGLRAAFGST